MLTLPVRFTATLLAVGFAFACSSNPDQAAISGELKKWHAVTLTFDGPAASETGTPNPFLDYRLEVVFSNGSVSHRVPGYFAADGQAAESRADRGDKWRVHFVPEAEGTWTYRASFRKGPNIAINPAVQAGEATGFDGAEGSFTIKPSDKQAPDFRGKGILRYVGKRYLQFPETGEYFLKGGADSPENFLAYFEFDRPDADVGSGVGPARPGEASKAALESGLHHYAPHARDWREGDPTWQNGKGKNIIGALNYLAGKGMNSVYFLTMNVEGDGKDVWPWTTDQERYRFDCSKLDQWDIVFSHMDKLGLMLHVVTQETENDQLLDGGDLGPQRKLYYRELIARFAHHLALVWNLGEENTNTDAQRKEFADFFHSNDPYQHPVVVHTYPDKYDEVYTPLLGFGDFEGPSLQMGDMTKTHSETLKWVSRSAETTHPWYVCLDEIGPADTGVKPDADDLQHDEVRQQALWGNLMAGGSGAEWYFGYKFPDNDLVCENWRSRDHMWDETRYALEFFHQYLPFAEMKPADDLVTSVPNAYCLAKAGDTYAVYLATAADARITLPEGKYQVNWYNPRQGGPLEEGEIKSIEGPGATRLGQPPAAPGKDWVALLKAER